MTRFGALATRPDIAQRLPKGLLYEAQKLYYDTASMYGPYPWPTILKLAPVSHILFGTDFPFMSAGAVAKGLSEVGIESERPSRHRTGKSFAIVPAVEECLNANNNPTGKPFKHRRAGVYFAIRNQNWIFKLRILAQVGVLP